MYFEYIDKLYFAGGQLIYFLFKEYAVQIVNTATNEK